jgi:hypothetical protein
MIQTDLEDDEAPAMEIVHWQPTGRHHAVEVKKASVGAAAAGAAAVGAFAVGALAIGALAIGALAISKLTVRHARFGRLEIDELVVRKLRVLEP